MNVEARGVTRRMSRLVRWLAGRNALRRPVDRIEGAVLVALSAVFLAAVAMAFVLGAHVYHSQRAASASLHPARGGAGSGRAVFITAAWPNSGRLRRAGPPPGAASNPAC